jgi:hypothetical protein
VHTESEPKDAEIAPPAPTPPFAPALSPENVTPDTDNAPLDWSWIAPPLARGLNGVLEIEPWASVKPEIDTFPPTIAKIRLRYPASILSRPAPGPSIVKSWVM